MLIFLCIVYSYFHTTLVVMSSCNRGCNVLKAYNIYHLSFYRKCHQPLLQMIMESRSTREAVSLFWAYVCIATYQDPSATADVFICQIFFWKAKPCTTTRREFLKSWCCHTINSILPIGVPFTMGLQGHLYHSSIHLFSHLTNICWVYIILQWTRLTPTNKEIVQDSHPEFVISLSILLYCLPRGQL